MQGTMLMARAIFVSKTGRTRPSRSRQMRSSAFRVKRSEMSSVASSWLARSPRPTIRALSASTVVIVGDGAIGLLAVLSAKQMGAEWIIAMSRHESRQRLAREFGSTDIVTERGDEGVARIKELTNGLGADSVIERVGTQESMLQAIRSTRPGGFVSYVGALHGVELDGQALFFAEVHLHGGPAPVRRYLPHLIELVLNEKINPGKVFDLVLPLQQVADGYRAMDQRRAIKTLLLT